MTTTLRSVLMTNLQSEVPIPPARTPVLGFPGYPHHLVQRVSWEKALPMQMMMNVTRLSGSPRVALARIWLTQPTPDCSGCPMAEACRTQSRCLQLVASGGRSVLTPSVEWTGIDGAFRRMPLGVRKVGRIAAEG